MKKKSIIARVGVMAAALTLATTSLMSGTLAKYTTEITGTATAVVAHWGVNVKDALSGGNEYSQGFKINLADEKYFTTSGDLKNTFAKVQAKDGEGNPIAGKYYYKIAPGAQGSVPIVVDMKGTDVDAYYEIAVKINPPTQPSDASHFFFYKDGNENTKVTPSTTWTTVASGVIPSSEHAASATATAAVDKQQYAQVTLGWKWPFDTTAAGTSATVNDADYDAVDTEYITSETGNPPTGADNAHANINVDIMVTVKQADGSGTQKWTPRTQPST